MGNQGDELLRAGFFLGTSGQEWLPWAPHQNISVQKQVFSVPTLFLMFVTSLLVPFLSARRINLDSGRRADNV